MAADAMMELYYAQRDHRDATGVFADGTEDLPPIDPVAGIMDWPPHMIADSDIFHARARVPAIGRIHLDQTGRIWWTDVD